MSKEVTVVVDDDAITGVSICMASLSSERTVEANE